LKNKSICNLGLKINIFQGNEYISEAELGRLASIRQRRKAHKEKALIRRGLKRSQPTEEANDEDGNLLNFSILDSHSSPVQRGLNGVVKIRETLVTVINAKDTRYKHVSVLDVMKSFNNVLTSLCNSVLIKLDDEDWIQVIIKSEVHNHHISTVLKRKKHFSVQDVLILVQDSVQSSFDMKLNDGIFVDIVTVQTGIPTAEISGGGAI
jgi:hypothetical protein